MYSMVRSGIKLWVREIEEYLFCPMVFYYSVALSIDTPKGYWADLGRELQEDVESLIEERFEVFAKEFEVESERLGVKGKVDYVIRDGRSLAPLEVKYSSKVRPWWRYSAALYGILLEDTIKKPVKKCYLFLTESNDFVSFHITDEDRRFVERAVKDCYEILSGKIPKPMESHSCKNCDYREFCSSNLP